PLVPEARSSPAPVAEALAARMAAVFPGHAWEGVPLPKSAAAAPASVVPLPPADSQAGSARMSETTPKRRLWRRAASRVFPTFVGGLPARAVALDGLRRAALVLVLMAVAAGASAGAVLVASPASDTGEVARRHVAPEPPMPSGDNLTLHASLARELAASRDSPQAGGGAAPFLPPTPAPELTTAMLRKEDLSENTPDKPQPQARRARFAEKCVTAACCAMLGGCAGSPPSAVRPVPKPEACPDDAVATMKKLGIRIGQDVSGTFLDTESTKPVSVNQFSTFILVDEFGELRPGTELSGRLIFAEGLVYGRFTQARQTQSKGGQTYPVCLQLRSRGRDVGVEMKSDGGPDSAVISSAQVVRAVDRFD
ncbi:MAG TPA: hypothetical protein VEU33_32530, partial [Archangium sp.]|nr:hypothetical protein [Archangium sp.]